MIVVMVVCVRIQVRIQVTYTYINGEKASLPWVLPLGLPPRIFFSLSCGLVSLEP